jgi:AraC family transcriptional regulator
LQTSGEQPADLAERVPKGSYRFTAPVERLGIAFARLTHRSGNQRFEAGLTPACDVMSLHLSRFDARVWRNGKIIRQGEIEASSLSLVKAGVRSDVELDGDIEILQVFLPPDCLAELSAEIIGWPTQPLIDGWVFDRRLEDLTMRACRASMSRHPAAYAAAEALALEVAEHLIRTYAASGPTLVETPHHGGISPHRLRHLIEYIESHLNCELSLGALAGEVHLSPYHFLRAFRVATGVTPHQWLMRRRIARAKQLLAHSELPLSMIAAEVGYSSQSALTAVFSKIVGKSPARWRDIARS